MSRPDGHITNDTRFGGTDLRLPPRSAEYGKIRDPEAGERRLKIEEIQEQRKSKDDNAEVWE